MEAAEEETVGAQLDTPLAPGEVEGDESREERDRVTQVAVEELDDEEQQPNAQENQSLTWLQRVADPLGGVLVALRAVTFLAFAVGLVGGLVTHLQSMFSGIPSTTFRSARASDLASPHG